MAEKALKKQGYKIILNNYVTPFGEADIVCSKDGAICFAEVKTRTSKKFGEPSQAVDYKKREKYRKIASYYLNSNHLEEVLVTFIVVEVLGEEINIITDAF